LIIQVVYFAFILMDIDAIFIDKAVALVANTLRKDILLGSYLIHELEIVFGSGLLELA